MNTEQRKLENFCGELQIPKGYVLGGQVKSKYLLPR